MGRECRFVTRAEALVPYLVCCLESEGNDYRNSRVGLFYRDVGRGERRVGVFLEAGPAVEMGDVGAGVENEKAVWIAADNGEDGGGDTVEVVVLPRWAADAVILNI